MRMGLQVSADYWAFLYLAWVMPLVGVSLLGDRGGAGETVASRMQLSRVPEPAAAIAA